VLFRSALTAERALWLQWTRGLTLSAFRDPEYDYWQALASRHDDDELQFFWQGFVVEAGRIRSQRYLNLGLLALARLPLSEDDGQRNLRLQVQALVNRYQRRQGWGRAGLEELADNLRGVMARNPSLSATDYRAFLANLLAPLKEEKTDSVLSLLGLADNARRFGNAPSGHYKLQPPGLSDATDATVADVRRAGSLVQAWQAIQRLLAAHEDYLRKSGDAYYFVRNLDRCARALCDRFPLRDPEIRGRLFQWIHLALRLEPEDPRLWMLWELALRQADQPQRAQWVLWEMTRRFPEQLPCRVELARLLAASPDADDQAQAQRLLQQVLQLDPENLHAFSTLAQLAIRRRDWNAALAHAREGLRIAPDNQSCAMLLAQTHARRNEGDDLQTAIDHLQRFVTRYPGNVKAEDYLGKLLNRQRLAVQGLLTPLDGDEAPAAPSAPAETDPAWRAFADSLHTDAAPADADERVLPLPQALRLALNRDDSQADALAAFDAAAQREFHLETRLWRYLQTLRGNAPAAEQARAREALQGWVQEEASATSQDDAWATYLKQHIQALNAAPEAAWGSGVEWLQALLDRHQLLPAPLLV
jgi:tetratricopeptide (TPR) repeat protein